MVERVAEPHGNTLVPDEVLAQTIASRESWQLDGQGHLYDKEGVWVAGSLREAAVVMRELGWFIPKGSHATGVSWREFHGVEDLAKEVRGRQVHRS